MKTIWILVLVKRGFIQHPEIFYDLCSAKARKDKIALDINLDYDEIEIFQSHVIF